MFRMREAVFLHPLGHKITKTIQFLLHNFNLTHIPDLDAAILRCGKSIGYG